MRLFLSSYRAGKHGAKLLELVGKGAKIAYISNSKDYKDPADRKAKIDENFDYWRSIGLKPDEIDLRPYFDEPGADKLVKGYGFIWLAGGNVFLLRRALSYSGLDRYLYDAVRKNQIVLGGESAGAIIMGPTLKHSEVETDNEDSPNFTPKPYREEVLWDGLDLVNFVPVPHYASPGYIGIGGYIKNLERDKIPYKTMTDAQAIIIDGDEVEFLS